MDRRWQDGGSDEATEDYDCDTTGREDEASDNVCMYSVALLSSMCRTRICGTIVSTRWRPIQIVALIVS